MTEFCAHCRQPLKASAFGIPMPPLKAEILSTIKASGDIGITTRELITMHYASKREIRPEVIKSHVHQINDLLASTDYEVRAEGRGLHARWRLHAD